MKKTFKSLTAFLAVLYLLCLTAIPALAATTKGITYYNTQYNNGTYTVRRIYYYIRPSTTQSTTPNPVPAPTNPTTPNPTSPTTPAPGNSTAPASQPSGTSLTAEESKMVNLVNQARLEQGVKPLSVNQQLVLLARLKSQDMVKNNYFSHTSPTYGSPFDMMKNNGIKYKTAGENLAGASTTESAHQNLMNSPGHRANILNGNFNQIGVGIASGSAYGNIYTQMFIGI
ncbi:MAG TPA: CAP domain-containing protein [Bacillota bacterium]